MSKSPWFKCFPSDFLNGVSNLSPNEIAVYTVTLMLIYDAGGPVVENANRIARQCNMRPTACEKAIEALVDAGKLVRVDGRLTNPRAEKEIESRQKVGEKSAINARIRWSDRAEKPNEINDTPMPTHCERDAERMLSRSQKPEARKETRVTALDGFAEWYGLYPNKVGKASAVKAWSKAKAKADQETLMAGLRAYIASKPPDRAWCNPATWLNDERWADQPAMPSALPTPSADWRNRSPDAIRAGRVQTYRTTGFWDSSWGPRPEEVAA